MRDHPGDHPGHRIIDAIWHLNSAFEAAGLRRPDAILLTDAQQKLELESLVSHALRNITLRRDAFRVSNETSISGMKIRYVGEPPISRPTLSPVPAGNAG